MTNTRIVNYGDTPMRPLRTTVPDDAYEQIQHLAKITNTSVADTARIAIVFGLAAIDAAAGRDEIERCPRCNDPVDDHIDPESSCDIWARGADGQVLTIDENGRPMTIDQ